MPRQQLVQPLSVVGPVHFQFERQEIAGDRRAGVRAALLVLRFETFRRRLGGVLLRDVRATGW